MVLEQNHTSVKWLKENLYIIWLILWPDISGPQEAHHVSGVL